MWWRLVCVSGSLPVVVVLLFICTAADRLYTQRPNIILIVADDLGWNDVSFHGSNQIPTPNIDALAYSGVILNNYYVQPICTPTRAALLTGRHPIHLGLQHGVLRGARPDGLGLNETLLPQYLHQLGYRTHMVGKWHLGMYANEFTPTYRGFETHYGYYQGAEDYFDHTSWQSDGYKGLDFRRNMEPVRDASNQYSTELFTSESEKIIRQHNQSEPLFLYLAHQAVHIGNYKGVPLQVPEEYTRRFAHIKNKKRRTFAGMVSALDDSVGNITKALHSKGLLNNSIIVFTTDNGGPANGYGRNCACNWPLRGVKHTLWEGGIRGVAFVWSPLIKSSGGGQVEPQVSNQLMHVCDWLPTLIHIAGGHLDQSKQLDGYNMWNSLKKGDISPRTEILHNIDSTFKDMNEAAIRVGNYKLIMGSSWPMSSLQWDGWYTPTEKCEYNNDSRSEMLGEYQALVKTSDSRERINHEKVWNTETCKLLNMKREDFSKPVAVSCKSKPVNSTKDCNPMKRPCLFDVVSDPCEIHNLASEHPDIAKHLFERLLVWNATAVPIKHSKDDPRGNPANFNNTWTPWIKLAR